MTGFLNIDKTRGDTSAYVVNRVKRLTKSSCGHLGTLDPLASGVLPVGIGNATRLFDYFLSKEKCYRARFRFGKTTPTLDAESEPEGEGRVPEEGEIQAVLSRFVGTVEQVPPQYSAVCVNGKRSYELARKGGEVDLPSRRVRIFSFSLLGRTSPDEFEFSVVCGGGTYIRALSRDVAAALGTVAYTTALRRTASGPFTEENAVPLSSLTAENWQNFLIPTESVLPFPALKVEDERYYHGVGIEQTCGDGVYKIYRGETFYGIGKVEGGVLRPEKKLC